MPQSLVNLHTHVIFGTKGREPFISPAIAPRLYSYLGGVIQNTGSVLVGAGGMPDHVHLLVSLGRQTCIADLVRDMKANSSRWVHDTYPDRSGFAWQLGYAGFAVSHSLVDRVRAYFENQAEHHRTRTFQDELREFLSKHGMTWDERYIWD